ncbi:MAG: hypothetical protein KF871_00840 [Hydrogenophaga sp.]|uniref:COG1470 family protein n=1 Tax=Hydrogenophaga sp. TaxID=1904254 RepID=UPI001DFDADC8|nr:hypothetical protein [Hydrogenophaga sp.]MBX3608413.1 hypothetical protein [Hydrogenophaga sp.]
MPIDQHFRRLVTCAALAAASAAQGQGFSAFISPPRFSFQVQPGQTSRQVFEIQHVGQIRGSYRVYTNDWTFNANQSVTFSDALTADSCRPWVAIERRELSIDPGSRYRYRFEVSPPADAQPRECRFALMVEGRDPTGGNVQASGRIGVIVYVAVGDVAPRLAVVGSRVQTIQGKPTPVIDVRNTGNAHGRLEGFLAGTDATGKSLEFGPADLPILPGETRSIALVALGEGNQPAPEVRFPVRIQGGLEWGDKQRLPIDIRFAP